MITCPKCSVVATPGASDCTSCGYIFSATESNPGFSPEKVFTWWLVFYAFWRVWALATNVLAAVRVEETVGQVFFGGAGLLAALSLGSIALLWQRRKLGLYSFLGIELLAFAWLLLFGQYGAAVYPLLAASIMWFVTKRAGNILK